MKKILAMLLTLAIALSLTACNNRTADPAGMPADASVADFSSGSSLGEVSSTLSDEDKALLESAEIPSSVSSETTVTTSDGSTVTVRPDGSKTIEKADGSTVTVTSEGSVTKKPAENGGGTSHEASSQSGGSSSAPSSKAPSSAAGSPSKPSAPSSSTPSSKPAPPPSSKPSEAPKPDPAPSSSPAPTPPPPSSAPEPDPVPPVDPSLAAYYYPYDTAKIKADMIAYGISRGLTLDTSLNLSNAGYDFPINPKDYYIVPITDEKIARLFQADCKKVIDYTIHQEAIADGITDQEVISDGMRFNIVVKTESDGSYSFYMPYG